MWRRSSSAPLTSKGSSGVQAVDASTIKLSFSKPFSPFVTYIADPYNVIYASNLISKYGPVIKDSAALVGTGPFMFSAYAPNQNSKVVRNPDYFVKDLPYLDAIETCVHRRCQHPDRQPAFGLDPPASRPNEGPDRRLAAHQQGSEDRRDTPALGCLPDVQPREATRQRPTGARQAIDFAMDRDEW